VYPITSPNTCTFGCGSIPHLEMATQALAYGSLSINLRAVETLHCGSVPPLEVQTPVDGSVPHQNPSMLVCFIVRVSPTQRRPRRLAYGQSGTLYCWDFSHSETNNFLLSSLRVGDLSHLHPLHEGLPLIRGVNMNPPTNR